MHAGGFLVRVARGVAESNSQRLLECLANLPLGAPLLHGCTAVAFTVSFITYIYMEVFFNWDAGVIYALRRLYGSRDSAVVRALASHQMWPGFNSRSRRHMWVKFVVGFRPCSDDFSTGTPVFLPPQKEKQHFQMPIRPGTHLWTTSLRALLCGFGVRWVNK